MTLTVPHIYTEYDSGMPHEIHLRLSNSTLTSLVTFSEQTSHTLVNFNSEGVKMGDYEVKLESFNTLSSN